MLLVAPQKVFKNCLEILMLPIHLFFQCWQVVTVTIVCFWEFMINDHINYMSDYLIMLIDLFIKQISNEQ